MSKRALVLIAVGIVFIAVGMVVFVVASTSQSDAPTALELTRSFDESPTGFSFRYPDDWRYTIPMRGLLISGLPETLNNEEAGPTFTIQRTQPLSTYPTLQEAMDLYLRRGALSTERQWTQTSDITPITFLGREALTVDLQGRDNEASPQQNSRIIVTTSENTFVYVMVVTAPVTVWERFLPTLQAILESVEILE